MKKISDTRFEGETELSNSDRAEPTLKWDDLPRHVLTGVAKG